jgi:hypothetical protein
MSLTMLGKGAAYEFRWRRWALLRDAVVHHLEAAHCGSRFPQFNSIGNALGVASIRIPAIPLLQEIEVIRTELAARSIEDLVIGEATASVLYPTGRHAAVRRMTQIELHEIAPAGDAMTLDRYFSSMLETMLQVCSHPDADGTIEVLDG